ncbi:MAG: hypothetical protein E4G90_03510 [Gemmatimonadales bacterium]|nr:ogr/Delta-like zinc finger family protein [Longimicrobiales bacterium]TFH66446.1 MAG: hypothetical protein E4G90_03510 [Gemmatimonadales bacterium]
MSDKSEACPHCGGSLTKWLVPDGATWDDEFFLVCFNNDCSYYKRGWEWMKEQYNQKASYRYALNPNNGANLMIPVWDSEATRQMIADDSGGGCG